MDDCGSFAHCDGLIDRCGHNDCGINFTNFKCERDESKFNGAEHRCGIYGPFSCERCGILALQGILWCDHQRFVEIMDHHGNNFSGRGISRRARFTKLSLGLRYF